MALLHKYISFVIIRNIRRVGSWGGGFSAFMVVCSGSVGDGREAQADVSKSFSIISSTSAGRYLWYFSGFLVKEMLAHLEEQATVSARSFLIG